MFTDPAPRYFAGQTVLHRYTGQRLIVLGVVRFQIIGGRDTFMYRTTPSLGRSVIAEEELDPIEPECA